MIKELVDTAKVYWLKDYYTTDDKKAFIAKVLLLLLLWVFVVSRSKTFVRAPRMRVWYALSMANRLYPHDAMAFRFRRRRPTVLRVDP